MFQVTIAFRCEDGKFYDRASLITIARGIIDNMRKDPVKYYEVIGRYVRPMTQREAGLHLNIDDCGTNISILSEIFGKSEKDNDARYYRTRIIAVNFWKLDFICKEALPFRICSENAQLVPNGMQNYKRCGIQHFFLVYVPQNHKYVLGCIYIVTNNQHKYGMRGFRIKASFAVLVVLNSVCA